MTKIALFVGIVLIGIFVVLLVSSQANQGNKNTSLNLSASKTAIQTATPTETPSATTTQTPKATSAKNLQATATIKTEKGDIVLTLFPKDAPGTVANFIAKANSGFYNNLTLHRVEDWVVQGGDTKGDGTGGGNMPTELNDKPFVVGSLGVARAGDIKVSNDSQFFITKKDSSFLNKQYTNFGLVTSGMDVVNQIKIGDKILGIKIE